MVEYGIVKRDSLEEEKIIYGYSYKDACKRAKLNPNDWKIIYNIYID